MGSRRRCSDLQDRYQSGYGRGDRSFIKLKAAQTVLVLSSDAFTRTFDMPSPCGTCKDTCAEGGNCGADCKCGPDCKCSETPGQNCGCTSGTAADHKK